MAETNKIQKLLASVLKEERKQFDDPDRFYSETLMRFPKQAPNNVSPPRVNSLPGIFPSLLRLVQQLLEAEKFIAFIQNMDVVESSELDPLISFFQFIDFFSKNVYFSKLEFILKSFQNESENKRPEQAETPKRNNEFTSNMITNLVHGKFTQSSESNTKTLGTPRKVSFNPEDSHKKASRRKSSFLNNDPLLNFIKFEDVYKKPTEA